MGKFPYETRDIKTCNNDEYEFEDEVATSPDGIKHKVIYNKIKHKYGYILNKFNLEDDSFYAPYLMHKIGQKVGIKTYETELGLVLHRNIDKDTYRDSYPESSIVYDDNIVSERYEPFGNGKLEVDQEEIMRTYIRENPASAQKRDEQIKGSTFKQTIDDYVDSNLYYLITRGSKQRQEYSRAEIDSIKQELVDRLLFGLKFVTYTDSRITLFKNENASLNPYYLSKQRMFSLNVREEWIKEQLEKGDEEFAEIVSGEYKTQYGIIPNTYVPSTEEVIKYIFDKYPEQAEKSYKKLSSFTIQNLNEELDSCKRMSDTHKKFAIRIFDFKNREFENVYKEYLRTRSR